jgi:hypothetical protein
MSGISVTTKHENGRLDFPLAHAVAHFAGGDVGRHGNNLAHSLVAKDSRKLSWKMSKGLVHFGIADAAGVHFDEDSIRSGLRLRNILDLPRTAHGGYDSSFHRSSSQVVRCKHLCDSRNDFHSDCPSLLAAATFRRNTMLWLQYDSATRSP